MPNNPKTFTLYFQTQPSSTVLPLGHVVVMSRSLRPDSSNGHVTLGKLPVHLCLSLLKYKKRTKNSIYLTGWLKILNEITHGNVII